MKDSRPRGRHYEDEEEDDDDDDDDEHEYEHEADADSRSGKGSSSIQTKRTALEKRPNESFVKSYFEEAKAILTSPGEFFELMPVKGGLLQPMLFLLVSAAIFSLLQAISKLNFFVLFTAMFSSFVNVFVASLVVSFACKKLGGKGTFEGTLRVITYSKATLLFAWLSLGPIPVGGIVSLVYSVYLNILGIEKVQKMPRKIVATLIIIVAVIGFILKFRFGI